MLVLRREPTPRVALLTEGVDRNTYDQDMDVTCERSPSSRRAWIEICEWEGLTIRAFVALLAEGVDRNVLCLCCMMMPRNVALLAEGVDRNPYIASEVNKRLGRPPHGGRG